MILDTTKNAPLYEGCASGLCDMMEFALSIKDRPAGKYERGEHFVLIQTPVTRDLDSVDYEAHRAYIDVQVVLEGPEVVRWAPLDSLEETRAYDGEKDVLFAKGAGSDVAVQPGMFYLMFPNDAHAPLGGVDGAIGAPLRKLVIKLKR